MKKKLVEDIISPQTVELLKKNNVKVTFDDYKESVKNKYSKDLVANNTTIYEGFDLLENLIVVRPYIQKKHDINQGLLELLLYLYGKKIFSQADYGILPKQFTYGSIKNLIDTGYVAILQEGADLSQHVYKLNVHGAAIVREFYGLLSGEIKFSDNFHNPFTNKKMRDDIDIKRLDLIRKLNQLPAPDKKKPLYL